MRSTTSVESLSSATSSGLPGSRPAASARRAAIFASVRSTIAERLLGEPVTIGARLPPNDTALSAGAAAAAELVDGAGTDAGARIDVGVPGVVIAGAGATMLPLCEIGGTT